MRETSLALALSGLSFMLAVIWGPPLLRVLRHFRIGKLIRVEGPDRHFTKMGTPTMGGVLIILPVALVTVLLNAASLIGVTVLGRSVLLPLLVMLSYALLGAIDDWEGIRGPRRGLGMRARTKFLLQVGLALVVAFALKYLLQVPELFWPGVQQPLTLGNLYIPIAVFIIVGASNAVNFTDGLDGLAGLIAATAFAPTAASPCSRDRSFWVVFALRWLGRCSVSCGGTSIPPNCSWAIPARWLWVPPLAWSR